MTVPAPSFEPRRSRQLRDELLARARLWLPDWREGGEGDVLGALLEIAARLEGQVAQRLDRLPEKAFRGYLDWLGVRGAPGYAARLPVAFTMTKGSDPVVAEQGLQLQAEAGGEPVIFETERPLRLTPAVLAAVIGADPGSDSFAEGPLSAPEAPKPGPSRWRILSEAGGAVATVQLEPASGLEPGLVLAGPDGGMHRITAVNDGLATLEPPLDLSGAPADAGPRALTLPQAFTPFEGALNDQVHALYLGAPEALDVSFPARLRVDGAEALAGGDWAFWGKAPGAAEAAWTPLSRESDGVTLGAPGGRLEPRAIAGRQARWLRLTPQAPPSAASRLLQPRLSILPPSDDAPASPAARLKAAGPVEAIANTTPVVLNRAFHPFGRDPRLFDAFYVSCDEAFSKPCAEVGIEFAMGGNFAGPLVTVEMDGRSMAAAVADDGALRLFVHAPGEAPAPLPPTQPSDDGQRPLTLEPGQRPGALFANGRFWFSAADRDGVHLLALDPSGLNAQWRKLGAPQRRASPGAEADADQPAPSVDTLLMLGRDEKPAVYALRGGGLYRRSLDDNAAWTEIVAPGGPSATLARMVGVLRPGAASGPSEADGVVLATRQGGLRHVTFRTAAGAAATGAATASDLGGSKLDPTFFPLAATWGAELAVATRLKGPADGSDGPIALIVSKAQRTIDTVLRGRSMSLSPGGEGGAASALFLSAESGLSRLARVPLDDLFGAMSPQVVLVEADPAPVDAPAPSLGRALAPLSDGRIQERRLEPEAIEVVRGAKFGTAVVADAAVHAATDDLALLQNGEAYAVVEVVAPGAKTALLLPPDAPATGRSLALFRVKAGETRRSGRYYRKKGLLLDSAHVGDVQVGQSLVLEPQGRTLRYVVAVKALKTISGKTYAQLEPENAPPGSITTLVYAHVTPVAGPLAVVTTSFVRLSETSQMLDAEPRALAARAGAVTINVTAVWKDQALLLLAEALPRGTEILDIVRAGSFGKADPVKSPALPNPTVSWEYWNGGGWWRIENLGDGTRDLVQSGWVTFCVPADLKPTDVLGRTKLWIRARLAGGDYGQEDVTYDGHSVHRDRSGVRAPYVVGLKVAYRADCPIPFDHVLTQDNGGFRDQTDAARTPGAAVLVFTPLSAALGATAAQLSPDDAGQSPADAAGRALYLGFDSPIDAGSLTLLVLAKDQDLAAAAPLAADGFIAGGFKPLSCEDETRALGETGLVRLGLPGPLEQATLFGRSLYWVRLRPAAVATDAWRPALRAIYPNGAWTQAATTRRAEMLGGSDGSPNQTFALAYAPVIEGSLVLRVREVLGDDQIAELVAKDPSAVVDQIGAWPGPWVRWEPDSRAGDDRAYTLDASKGEIRFGDGRRGRIPPLGRDVICAEIYKVGGGAAANAVKAWSQLNLISPVRGVDAAFAPEGAAGGADPQSAEDVLFHAPADLARRGRAVTLADYERLAETSSSRIAQARALPTRRGLRVVVATRGGDFQPSQADLRSVRNTLLRRGDAGLARKNALEVAPVRKVPIKVTIMATVGDLATGAVVADRATAAILQLLDPAAKAGAEKGWPVGSLPADSDIAAALADIPGLDGIAVTVERADGWGGAAEPDAFPSLAAGDLRVISVLDERLEAS